MAEKPTYEELEKRVSELEQQVDQKNTSGLQNPPELLSALMEAFRDIPLCQTFEDAAKRIFEQCKKLTGARSGYVALLSENGEENEVLFLDAGGMPCDVDPNLPMPIRGLREIAYKTKDVTYDNSFPESSWMEFMPEGHVKLDNVLFAPLNIADKTAGIIGIANKSGGFNENDVHISRTLGDLAAVTLSYAKAQENLRENEAKLRSMLNASPLAIVLLNRTGCVLDCNEEHASRLKVRRDEILGRCLWELLPKEVLAHRRRQVEEVFETGRPLTGEDRRGDIWNQYHIHPAIIDNSGKVQAVIVEAIDITERKMAEKALSQIFTMSMDMLCISDIHSSTFIKVNPAFTEILGFSEAELLGKPFLDLIHPGDIDATRCVINKKLQMGEKVINFENRYQCKNGKYRWLSWASHPNIEEGVTFSVARDITEWKQQEEALKHSKAILDATGRMAKVGGWEVNADTMEVTWTEETYRIHEVPFDQKPPLQEAINFFHPEDRPKLEQAVRRALDFGEPYDMEVRFVTAKGKHLWTHTICRPVIINGKVIKLMGTFQDITERKQAQEALEESKAFLDNMSDIAYIADAQGNLIWVNFAVKQMTGFLPEELFGKPFLPLFTEEDHASLMDVYQRTLNGERLENTLTFKTGITCHFTSLPKRNNQGEIIGTFGVARDISESQAAEQALQTSEARLKRAQKMAKVGNWEYDIATGRVWGSEEAFRIYGIERASEFLALDEVESYIIDAKRVDQALVDLLDQNKAYDIEFQINPKNRKELIHVHSMAELVYDGDGKPEKVVGVIQDITESKQAEEILQKNHDMFKRTEAMARIGSWEWDVHHDRTFWSEELFRIFGRDPAEGAPPFAEQSEFYDSGDMPRLRDAVEICVKRGTPYEIELKAVRPDGEIRYCVSRGQPQYDENGKVFRLTGSFQDITDRKHAENRIKSAERLNQALLDHSPVCHKIVDLDFNLQYMSANGFKMLKLDHNAEVYGKPYPFYFFPKVFKKQMTENLMKVKDTGETITMAALTNDIEKNEVWLDSSLIPVFDEDGNIDFITVVSANITQRISDEKRKEQLEAQLLQAQKMESIGTLAGGIAHDFNNILSAIIGFTELALDEVEKNTGLGDNLQEVYLAGQRAKDLVKQILTISRHDEKEVRPILIAPLVKESLKMLRATIPSSIEFQENISSDQLIVNADPTQLQQVIVNLATNAKQAMVEGNGVLKVMVDAVAFGSDIQYRYPDMQPGRYARIMVSDTGSGISAKNLEKIFEPYFTTKEKGEGTGLGLSVVHGIVKSHHGHITVYSDPGKGTTFHVYLPLVNKTSSDLLDKPLGPLPTGTERILLVDDDPLIVKMQAQHLNRLGYTVIPKTSSTEALETFGQSPDKYDLIITDMTMPKMTGDKLTEEIKRIRPDIKVILCTGFSEKINVHAEYHDIDALLMKPFNQIKMAQTVRKVLDEAG